MAKVKMIVPNKQYNGYYGGVAFHNGEGIFEDVEKAKELANRYGYKVEPIDVEVSTEVEDKVEDKVEEEVKPKPKRKPRKPKAKAGE